jgi:hypothetical protein
MTKTLIAIAAAAVLASSSAWAHADWSLYRSICQDDRACAATVAAMSASASNAGLKLAPLRMNGPSCGAVGKIPHGGRDRGTATSNSQLVPINTGSSRIRGDCQRV